jgi:chemotaxis response regulator CheB
MPRVFIVYEHRLFTEILSNVLGSENIVGTVGRADTPLTAMVEAINGARPNVVILESEANGNNAWHILLASGGAIRVIVFDMERGLIRDYSVKTSAIDTLEELLNFIRPQ